MLKPSRPILYKPFGFLKSVDLKNIGLKLEDIPYDFGWNLVPFRKSSACLKSGEEQEPIREASEDIGAKDKFFLPTNDSGHICLTKSHSFGLFPKQETGAETASETFDLVFKDDLGDDVKDDSEDTSNETRGNGGRMEVSPAETEQATPVQQTGEKRKRYKIVARRSRMPRLRTPSRPKSGQAEEFTKTPAQPQSKILSQAKSTTRPTRKSARIAFQATPRPATQSSPVIEEMDSSSESSSDHDTENTSFKWGTPVFS